MSEIKRILIIEDEADMAKIMKDVLTLGGYDVRSEGTGTGGLETAAAWNPHLILLDLTLPDLDGIEVCRRIREESVAPILILSARGGETDKILGLGFGADDYMTKPFSFGELTARIGAQLRRSEMQSGAARSGPESSREGLLSFGELKIDKKAYRVESGGREISFSAREFELLHFLALHEGQVFSKARLLDSVWGYDAYGDEATVTVYIRRIREKIEADPSQPAYLRTVWGVGYKFDGKGGGNVSAGRTRP
ncbi:response regulator transcription factor [Saccharibacillus alkalitolerans]|uniref:Response regulator transcription factor n=1 Tax=Saccharibacillus alkalitolerans TaxID=2705290 RepID=A0ABX0F5P4_9BACL|nr:response regulator transcription factor [Saccharibacillus alkalitolerans]NGZ75785.1 response regulator transcription factor [Saccharibacillus alkalitolerans]